MHTESQQEPEEFSPLRVDPTPEFRLPLVAATNQSAKPAASDLDPTNPAVDRLNKAKARFIPVIVVAVALLLLGILGVQTGLIQVSSLKNGAVESETVADFSPPPAHLKKSVHPNDKYGPGFSVSSLNPSEEKSAEESSTMTGRNSAKKNGSNEFTAIPLENPAVSLGSVPTYRPRTKREIASAFQAGQARLNRENNQVIQTMCHSPESQEQRSERLVADEERRYARKSQERLLALSEKAVNLQGLTMTDQPQSTLPQTQTRPLQMDQYYQRKAAYKGNLPPLYQRIFSREIQAEQSGTWDGSGEPVTQVLPDESAIIHTNTRSVSSAFYSVGGQVMAVQQSLSSRNAAIPAVIHGDGDGIVVQAGATIMLRLTQDTELLLNGDRLVLPINSLLAGTCSITGDRIQIQVTTIRQGTNLYQTNLTAYDLDGRVGLRVPGLTAKSKVHQSLVQTAQSSVSSPTVFIPQGSFGTQVGAQVGSQAVSSLFQGVRQVALAKLSTTKVAIRPNYQILLKSTATTRGNQVVSTDEQ